MPKFKEELESSLMVKEPNKYKVILHNDDYTTMEFVIGILMRIFHKSMIESEKIMLKIHNSGKGVCGIYTYEIAQTKVYQVRRLARESGYPLLATLEEE